jgi:UDP-glucose 4-epimerase
MKILITGGAGFVGSHLANRLARTNNKIYVVDDLSSGKKTNLRNKKIKFIKTSILNKKKINDVLINCDVLIHLAAFVEVEKSIHYPKKCILVNIKGIENILSCKNISFVKKIIFASSCSIYSDDFKKKLHENSSLKPTTPYAASKLLGEILIKNFCIKRKIKYVILRCFNIYGANDNKDSIYSAVINKFILESISKNKITVYGSGKQTRDFVFIKDVVDIYQKMITNSAFGTFNLGSGRAISINLIAKILKKINKKLIINFDPFHNVGIKKSITSIKKIKKITKFKPNISFARNIKVIYKNKYEDTKKNKYLMS